MPTTVAIQFPWGRYHGTPWGRNVNEGVVDWPPEPWRLLRALYATWRARAPELPEAVVADLLDVLADPPSYVVPPYRVAHTRHWYPDAKHGPKGGGTDKVFDTFAVVPRDEELRIIWPAVLEPAHRDALTVLCDRLTYLGRADSICAARLVDGRSPDDVAVGQQRLEPVLGDKPDGKGPAVQHVLAGTRPLQLDTLEVRPQRMRKQGRLEPPGSRRVPYPVVPEAEPAVSQTRPRRRWPEATAVRFRITAKALPAPEATLAMAEALRQATVAKFDPVGTGRESVTLFGKDRQGVRVDTGHRHAHYLALSSAGAYHRLLDTLVVWAPDGLDDAEIDALAKVDGLRGRSFVADFRPCRLAVEAVGEAASVVPELTVPARRWRSATPYAPPRNVRRQPTWEAHAEHYLRRDLQATGLTPAQVEPLREQWLAYRRHRITEKRPDARRATGFTLTFDQEVEGPICLGALRHLGLGLFLPDP